MRSLIKNRGHYIRIYYDLLLVKCRDSEVFAYLTHKDAADTRVDASDGAVALVGRGVGR